MVAIRAVIGITISVIVRILTGVSGRVMIGLFSEPLQKPLPAVVGPLESCWISLGGRWARFLRGATDDFPSESQNYPEP